ncbi:hypothetical protein V2I01_39210 [Micromonospora sp. BRA006-A]|nr:hypothetical protein [Micromonospora sp. BRA006-A]
MTREFVNWSGSLRFTPADRAEPADEAEVCALVRRARLPAPPSGRSAPGTRPARWCGPTGSYSAWTGCPA